MATKTVPNSVRMGAAFEAMVGRPLSDFHTPQDLEKAMEQKLGRPLVSVKSDPAADLKRLQKIVKESRALLEKF